jgi:hypothetical protein
MIITTTLEPKTVHDYEIALTSGAKIPITLDLSAGDSIDFQPEAIRIKLASRPSPSNPQILMMAEECTYFMRHVIGYSHRTRQIIPLSPEQKEELRQAMLTNTVPTRK